MKWYKADICPEEFYAILYCTTNGRLGVFKEGKVKDKRDWKWLVEKYSIEYWTTQYEIIRQINDNDNERN